MTENKKIALITGASRGLGFALAEHLASSHHIIAVAKTAGALEELDDAIKAKGGSATLAPMDITDPNAMAHMCKGIFDRWKYIDLWAHTAIYGQSLSPADHIDMKDFSRSMNTNAVSFAQLITFVSPLLQAAPQRADVLLFEDTHLNEKFFGAYGSSKAAQMVLAKNWQQETQTSETAPKIHILQPKPMPTGMRARFHPGEDKSALHKPKEEAARLLREANIAL